jgi:hypothetical protein
MASFKKKLLDGNQVLTIMQEDHGEQFILKGYRRLILFEQCYKRLHALA